jgi:hypothetical protein
MERVLRQGVRNACASCKPSLLLWCCCRCVSAAGAGCWNGVHCQDLHPSLQRGSPAQLCMDQSAAAARMQWMWLHEVLLIVPHTV